MKKNCKSQKRQQQSAGRIITKPSKPSAWDEPALHQRDAASGVTVAVHDDDRGTYHALQHRSIERVDENVDGRVKTVTRTINTVRQMALDGEISIEMHQQAQEYKHWFDRACMDQLRASPMDGMPRSSGSFRQVDENTSVADARDRVHSFHDALNGPASRMSVALYRVVGMEWGFGGRGCSLVERVSIKANLITALERLVWVKNGCSKKRR